MAGESRRGRGALEAGSNGQVSEAEVLDLTDEGLHIEGYETSPLDDGEVDTVHQDRYGALENLIDAYVDAFNAHDLDGMTTLFADDVELPGLGGDTAGFPETIGSVWQRRPNAILTRGLLGEEPVTVVWDVDGHGTWQRIALFCYDTAGDAIGLIELIDDASVAEDVETGRPERDLAEGATWDEWYEGAEPA